jgi:hypothetical protein
MLQAFANCNASVSHRGTVDLSKQPFPNRGGVMQPYANGGGVSGVSFGGPADYGGVPPESYSRYDGGFAPDGKPGRSQDFYQNANSYFPAIPGSTTTGGANFSAPDITTFLPPWGWEPGMGSGQTGPTNLFFGPNYYGSNSYNVDYSFGGPSNSFLTQINTGGDYYDNSTHYGAGGYQNNYYEGGRYYDGDNYFTEGDTNYTSIYPGGDNTFYGDSYYNSLYNEGDNVFNGGDTFSSYEITNRGGDYYAGDWHTVNNDNSITIGGPNIDNTTNYSYGGDTFVVNGDTIFNGNTTINNNTTNNYGNPGTLPRTPGQPGPGGGGGPAGAPGAPGAPGQPGRDGGGGGFGPGGGGRADQQLVVTNVTTRKKSVQALAGVTFDPDTCQLQLAFVNIDYVADATGEKQLIRFRAP